MHNENNWSTRRRLLPPRALGISLLAQIPLVAVQWPIHVGPVTLIAGLGLFLSGALLNVWSDSLFQKNNVGVCPFSQTPVLVASGPYRWTRNPMYLGLVLISASPAILFGVFWNLAAAALLLLWLHFRFVLPEEMYLREQFGAAYLAYASANPRWIGLPGPKIDHRGEIRTA